MLKIFLLYTFLSLFLYYLLIVSYFYKFGRFNVFNKKVIEASKASVSTEVFQAMFGYLSLYLVYNSFTANFPGNYTPSLYYIFVFFVSACFWISIITYALSCRFVYTLSHYLPEGTPLGLMLIIPVIEVFSQIIRPLTLTIRFATNIAAGHIIMFIFSYFSTLAAAMTPPLFGVILVLTLLEIFVAFLQAYIFVRLLSLYISETTE